MPDYEKYVAELDRKNISDVLLLELCKKGCDFFDFLLNSVENDSLRPRQSVNSLMVMFEMLKEQCSDKRLELYRLAYNKSLDQDIDVRSFASIVVIRLVIFKEKVPEAELAEIDREAAMERIKESLKLGLLPNSISYVEDFLTGNI